MGSSATTATAGSSMTTRSRTDSMGSDWTIDKLSCQYRIYQGGRARGKAMAAARRSELVATSTSPNDIAVRHGANRAVRPDRDDRKGGFQPPSFLPAVQPRGRASRRM